ncbi:MAG: MBL fold metallo-hydrolase [Candidatus Korarchaeota archaeon]|nr:MBL fold metallo-hydrolase [Candidatus Korarchaeota archaeon]
MTINYARIVVVVDNNVYKRGLASRWGFSAYVETPRNKLLFDTDSDPLALEENANKLGINLSDIDAVIISHSHGDHTGGLSAISKLKPGINVYIPEHAGISNYIRRLGLIPVPISKTRMIFDDIYIIGELSAGFFGLWEEAMAIKIDKKLVVLCGCSHPGVDKIAEKAVNEIGGRLYIILGGFHGPSTKALDRLIELGATKVYPLHCSGDSAVRYIKQVYPDRLGIGGSGLEIKIEIQDENK